MRLTVAASISGHVNGKKSERAMKIEIADYIELAEGGAVVTLEMDEEARMGLIVEAIKSRILAGLEAMDEMDERT